MSSLHTPRHIYRVTMHDQDFGPAIHLATDYPEHIGFDDNGNEIVEIVAGRDISALLDQEPGVVSYTHNAQELEIKQIIVGHDDDLEKVIDRTVVAPLDIVYRTETGYIVVPRRFYGEIIGDFWGEAGKYM